VRPLAFCIPGDLSLPTGGYRYDREVLARLPRLGVAATHAPLGPGFPHPDAAQIDHAMRALAAQPRDAALLIDGLALGALPPEAIAALPHRRIALVHHPLALEAGMPSGRADFLRTNEAAVLSKVRHVVATSHATRRILEADFGVPSAKLTVVEPGVDRRPRAVGSGDGLHVLAVGAVSPRKDYPRLVDALASIGDVDWRLTIAGSLTLAPDEAANLGMAIAAKGLADRVALAGAVADDELLRLFASADLFASASLFEGYGMALAEALAHGLPIVASSGGAAADTVPDGAALKVPPGDARALSAALGRVLKDGALRRRMGDASWAAAALLPSWDDAARDIADLVKTL
jgi:glycosyltransferase involved in cell wall biosynthesis